MIFVKMKGGAIASLFFCPFTECKTTLSKRYMYMIHLKPSDAIKAFQIINRKYSLGNDDLRLNLRDEQTNETVSYDDLQYLYESTTQYLRVYGEIDLVEGHTYEIELISISTGNVWHRNKIFATDQTIDQNTNENYSINDGEYTEHSNENEFIIL